MRQTRLRRSSSTRSLLANVEASTSRKRDRSPFREEGEVANMSKRRRLADLVEEGETREEGRNEASAPVSHRLAFSTGCELSPFFPGKRGIAG